MSTERRHKYRRNKTKKWSRIKDKNKLIKKFRHVKSLKYKYKNKWFIKHLSRDSKHIKYVNSPFNNKLVGRLSPDQMNHILLFSQYFSQQTCQTFCASAALVIILNIINRNGRLMFDFPYLMDNTYLPYPIITQRSLYNIISQTEAMGTYKGLTLEDVMVIFQTLGINAKIIRPPSKSFTKKFIEKVYRLVNKKHTYVLLNYGCAWKTLGAQIPCLKGRQEAFTFVDKRDAIFWHKKKFPYQLKPRGGHFVPIAAAVKYQNRYWFLIVEVANFKYNWFWIDGEGLYDTMSTFDSDTTKYRGLVIIKE